jgi:catechol 2,3-dioxygenase-like lactoylglutathione lyase family enzyme
LTFRVQDKHVAGGGCIPATRHGKELHASMELLSANLREIALIGYITLGTNDLERARIFYDAVLSEMGVRRLMDFGDRGYGWAASLDKPMLCIFKPYDGRPATVGNGVMAGISADSRETVDRLYNKALELGGTDEGKPGLRAEGGDGFYAAYFRDLDGNKLDVFCYS